MDLTPSQRDTATNLGQRAGQRYRDTGITQRNPFAGKPQLTPLSDAWTTAYVTAAHRST